MIDFCFDISPRNPSGEKIVAEEIIAFIDKYFPENNNSQLKIIITKDISRTVKMFCELINFPYEFASKKPQGFATEINGIIFLIFDYEIVGFPYLFQHNETHNDFWQKVKEYVLHHELQHIKNKKTFTGYLKLGEETTIGRYFCDLFLDEYQAIYFSLLNLGNDGILPMYIDGSGAYEGFKALAIERPKTIPIDIYIHNLTYCFIKLIAFYHVNHQINQEPYSLNLDFLPIGLSKILVDFDNLLLKFTLMPPEIFFQEMEIIVGNLFILFSESSNEDL